MQMWQQFVILLMSKISTNKTLIHKAKHDVLGMGNAVFHIPAERREAGWLSKRNFSLTHVDHTILHRFLRLYSYNFTIIVIVSLTHSLTHSLINSLIDS